MGDTYTSMADDLVPRWLMWARDLQAVAQTGLAFAIDPHDRQRYEAVRRIAAEIVGQHSATDATVVEALFAEQHGYATPKVDVRGAAFREGKILLVREVADGRWTLPGGWADVNESPGEAVAREVMEESGFNVTVLKLAAVYDRSRHPHTPVHAFHSYKLFFICQITGGNARVTLETSDVGFFGESSLPDLSVARVLDYQIRRMFTHHREPSLATDFD